MNRAGNSSQDSLEPQNLAKFYDILLVFQDRLPLFFRLLSKCLGDPCPPGNEGLVRNLMPRTQVKSHYHITIWMDSLYCWSSSQDTIEKRPDWCTICRASAQSFHTLKDCPFFVCHICNMQGHYKDSAVCSKQSDNKDGSGKS